MHLLTGWDVLLLVVVSVQATILAYLHRPHAKALVLALPIPFTAASLALGGQVNVTHALGFVVMYGFIMAVRWLYVVKDVPIVMAIAGGAVAYALIGSGLAAVVSRTELTFWAAIGLMIVLGLCLRMVLPVRKEQGHRTPLPIWVKLPIVMGIILCLILVKRNLQGFMTTFPMVGVVALYESRHSLWTVCRQIAVLMVCMGPMFAVIHVCQPVLGVGTALVAGWLVYLTFMYPMTRSLWRAGTEAEN